MNMKHYKVLNSKLEIVNNYVEGYVIDNNDPFQKSRVKVLIPGMTMPPPTMDANNTSVSGGLANAVNADTANPNNNLDQLPEEAIPWYTCLGPAAASGNSTKSVPEVGARVLISFPDNDFYNGIIVGTIPTNANGFTI